MSTSVSSSIIGPAASRKEPAISHLIRVIGDEDLAPPGVAGSDGDNSGRPVDHERPAHDAVKAAPPQCLVCQYEATVARLWSKERWGHLGKKRAPKVADHAMHLLVLHLPA